MKVRWHDWVLVCMWVFLLIGNIITGDLPMTLAALMVLVLLYRIGILTKTVDDLMQVVVEVQKWLDAEETNGDR